MAQCDLYSGKYSKSNVVVLFTSLTLYYSSGGFLHWDLGVMLACDVGRSLSPPCGKQVFIRMYQCRVSSRNKF